MDIKCPVDTITHKGSSVRINSKVEKKVGQLFNFVLFTLPQTIVKMVKPILTIFSHFLIAVVTFDFLQGTFQ